MKTIFYFCIAMFVIGMVFWGLSTIDFNKKEQTVKETHQNQKVLKTTAPTQMVIDVIMPAYVRAQQNDADLYHRNPEAYTERFNSNNKLYNRSVTFPYENGVNVGDTIQLSYCSYFNYQDVSIWNFVSIEHPFYERTEQTESKYIEYIKGTVREVK